MFLLMYNIPSRKCLPEHLFHMWRVPLSEHDDEVGVQSKKSLYKFLPFAFLNELERQVEKMSVLAATLK